MVILIGLYLLPYWHFHHHILEIILTNVITHNIIVFTYLNYLLIIINYCLIFILIAGYQIHSPAYYYPYFKENNVKHVVRLNSKKTYDAKRTFVTVANIQHTDLIFTDGTPPSDAILKCFLRLCEQYIDDNFEVEHTNNVKSELNEITPNLTINSEANVAKYAGAVAVHCKGKINHDLILTLLDIC